MGFGITRFVNLGEERSKFVKAPTFPDPDRLSIPNPRDLLRRARAFSRPLMLVGSPDAR